MDREAYCRACDQSVQATGAWPGRCSRCQAPIEAQPVPDAIEPGLTCLFVATRPGVPSARQRLPLAEPDDAFWGLVHEAGLTDQRRGPGQATGLLEDGLGLVYAATRATQRPTWITDEDAKQGRARLGPLVDEQEPTWVAFLGPRAYRLATGQEGVEPGLRPHGYPGCGAVVLPATDPTDQPVTEAELTEAFESLAGLLATGPPAGRQGLWP